MAKLNTDTLLLFEQPLAKVPYEQLRKVFRTSQRIIDRDFAALSSAASDIVVASGDEDEAKQAVSMTLDSMIARVEGLQRKLSDVHTSNTAPIQTALRARMQHIAAFQTLTSVQDPRFGQWADARLERWLVDWLLRNGHFETAKALSDAKDLENLVDVELFAEIRRINLALEHQSCSEALSWCSENKVALRKIKSTLEFDLRIQEFIELARAGKSIQAIAYSKKHLTPWHDTHMPQLRQAMALLAYPAGPSLPRTTAYKRLYDLSRWKALAENFTDTAYTLTGLPSSSLFTLALYAGIVALKHPACMASDPLPSTTEVVRIHTAAKNQDCPICDPSGLGALAHEVPSSHHLNSTLVCALSGRIMDDLNPPMAFKNGYVYSYQALEDMASKNGGRVTCPRSGQTCHFTELRKCFIS